MFRVEKGSFFEQQLMAMLLTSGRVKAGHCHWKRYCAHLSVHSVASQTVGNSSLYLRKENSSPYCCSAQQQQHVVWCEISTPSKTLQPVALWNISMREKATQAQSVAISPQPLALSYAAKHGTPAFIKHSLEITTGRNNYSLTLTLMACVCVCVCVDELVFTACACVYAMQYALHSIP